jgi:hypothetical protein
MFPPMPYRAFHASAPRLARIAASAALALIVHACDVLDDSQLKRQLNGAGGDASGAGGSSGSSGTTGGGGATGVAAAGGSGGGRSDAGTSGTGAPPGDGSVPPAECSPPAIDDHCARIGALSTPPVIDGTVDCGARLLELTPTGWNGAQAMPAHRTLLAAAARPDGLYVYIEVHGGVPPRPHPAGSYIDCGDAVEIYIDADGVIDTLGAYSKPGTMQFIVAAPSPAAPTTIEAMRFVGGETQGAWLSQQVRTALLPDGYAVEAFITASDLELTAWAPGSRIGLDIAVDVAADAPVVPSEPMCEMRLGQYFMRMGGDDEDDAGICHGKPWCDTRAFCTPEIAAR